MVFAEPLSMTVVEVVLAGDAIVGRAIAAGADGEAVWPELLRDSGSVGAAGAALEALEGTPCVPVELLARVQRWWLPTACRVVEIRGRREVESARVIEAAASRRAIDALLGSLERRPNLEAVLGPLTEMAGLDMALGGRMIVDVRGAATRSLGPDSAAEALSAAFAGARLSEVDRAVGGAIARFGRREGAMPSGAPDVEWRFPALRVGLRWRGGEVTAWPL